MDTCVECGSEFQRKTSNQKFCSAKCRTRKHVRNWAKRNAKSCKCCGTDIKHNSTTDTCRECLRKNERRVLMEMALGDYLARTRGEGKDRYNGIRALARTWNADLTKEPCHRCGYDKHSELAHKKAISEYDRTATLAEVNGEDNVIPLCPNCHWELDHGLWSIGDN